MNKSKQEFVKELNQLYKGWLEWMLHMPHSITTLELVQRWKNPLFYREVKLIRVEGDWNHYLVKTQRVKGLVYIANKWLLKVEVSSQESSVFVDPETGNETSCGNPVGNNWEECSVSVHFLEMEDKEVSILRNNFPDIWERL